MNKVKEDIYEKEGTIYPLIITYKRGMRSIRFRFKNGSFYVSCPCFTTRGTIVKGIDKFFDRLTKVKEEELPYDFTNNYVYIFGEKFPLDGYDEKTLQKKLKALLLDEITRQYSDLLKIMPISRDYRIRISNAKSRYGSNSRRTNTLSFSLQLVHYTKEAINSVVVHELAHDKYMDHSKKFYEFVYKYCPNYNMYRKQLIHKKYSGK